jgi:hypothetical protein
LPTHAEDVFVLVIGRIVTPAEGRKHGWDKELINASGNFDPRHANCAKAAAISGSSQMRV